MLEKFHTTEPTVEQIFQRRYELFLTGSTEAQIRQPSADFLKKLYDMYPHIHILSLN